jgi:hypothetical protein
MRKRDTENFKDLQCYLGLAGGSELFKQIFKQIAFPISSFQIIALNKDTHKFIFFELCYLSCHTVYYFLNWKFTFDRS